MVTYSIPDEVIGVLNSPNPYSRTIALGSTQASNLPQGKGRLVGA
jgi:hypothetical protein